MFSTLPTLALKHLTGFLLVRHFSPSISKRWQARERNCACMCTCTHAPLSLTFTHMHRKLVTFTTESLMHPQEVFHWVWVNVKREVETGCSFVLNRKTVIVGFVIGFASDVHVTQRFLILCLRPLGLISFVVTACVEWICRWKCAATCAQCIWLQ